jgi:hypothetical protein
MDGPILLSYVEQCLAPTLGGRDTVVMDDLGAHRFEAFARRSKLWEQFCYLLQYSSTSIRLNCPSAKLNNFCARLLSEQLRDFAAEV